MLSESSYLNGLYVYVGAGGMICLLLTWWLSGRWKAGWVCFTVLVAAALLLTPAFPNGETDTYAPALIVAIFETLTHGPDAAQHAFKPLGAALGAALIVAILLRLIVFRGRSAAVADADGEQEAA